MWGPCAYRTPGLHAASQLPDSVVKNHQVLIENQLEESVGEDAYPRN